MCQCGLGRVQFHNIQDILCYFSLPEEDMGLPPTPPMCHEVFFSFFWFLQYWWFWHFIVPGNNELWIYPSKDISFLAHGWHDTGSTMRSCFLSFHSFLLLSFWRLVVSSDILWISLLAQGRHETGSAMRAFVPWGALRRSWLERAPGAPHPPHGAPHPPHQGLMVPVFMASN